MNFQLEVFLNQDPERPLTFSGENEKDVLGQFRIWMQENRAQVNGLVLPVRNDEESYDIVIHTTDDQLKTWRISWGWGEDCIMPWTKAKQAILHASYYEVIPMPTKCVVCRVDCRVGFPACEVTR